MLTMFRPYYPDTCIDIHIGRYLNSSIEIRSITFILGDLSEFGAYLLILDEVYNFSRFWHFILQFDLGISWEKT